MNIKDPKNSVRNEQFSNSAENSFNEPEKDESKKAQQDEISGNPSETKKETESVEQENSGTNTGSENSAAPTPENNPPRKDSPESEKSGSTSTSGESTSSDSTSSTNEAEDVEKKDVTPGEPVEKKIEDGEEQQEENGQEDVSESNPADSPENSREENNENSDETDVKTEVIPANDQKSSEKDQESTQNKTTDSREEIKQEAETKEATAEEKPDVKTKEATAEEKPEAETKETSAEEKREAETKETIAEEKPEAETKETTAEEKPEAKTKEATAEEKPDVKTKETTAEEKPEAVSEEESNEEDSRNQAQKEESVNYGLLNKSDLVKVLKDLVSIENIKDIRDDVEKIKQEFYKKHQEDTEKEKAAYVEKGGDPEAFEPEQDPDEMEMRDLLRKYRDMRSDYAKLTENEKDVNLRKKYEIIDEIKDLINRDESINKTFQEFRDLQKRWHETGVVPQKELKNLWENYHYHVEKFYDYIKINKELRDLDLKKNLEAKLDLCEKAEALLLEPNVVNAFQTLQKYHDQWREIGPVPKDKRTELWERFREATAKINKRHQQYYHDLKESQKKNLESKTVLCEKAEELAKAEYNEHEQWVKKTRDLLELQKVWKTIGFAPKKDNNRIYARFRAACDLFFEKKREFYAQSMEEQQKNMQQKLDLCVQAEALQESEDWRGATDELIRLQKKWKKIGPVPRKHSDELWKRFRGACDRFFNRKSDFFSKIDTTYEKNLEKKEALIQEIKDFELEDNLKQNLKKLNDFQRRWSEIGFVPIEKKDEIMQNYREAINEHYDNLEMDDYKKNMLKFRNKVDNIRQKPRSDIKLRFEREKLMNKLQQLKSDIGTWENNIGFFADTENADSMVKDFEKKIKAARDKIKLLEDKIILIDEIDTEQ